MNHMTLLCCRDALRNEIDRIERPIDEVFGDLKSALAEVEAEIKRMEAEAA